MRNIQIIEGGNGNINLLAGETHADIRIVPDSVAQSPSQSNLIYLFDPVYYNNGYIDADNVLPHYIANLKNIFDKYPSIIPPSEYVFSRGHIFNKTSDPNNLQRKQYFDKSNFVFAYEKDANNTDIQIGNFSSRGARQDNVDYGVKERRKALLQLSELAANNFRMLNENTSKTFSCFVKLKGPVQHRSQNFGNRIIREKKGIFLNTKEFSIGYRSPHYTRTGNVNGYKFKFEPFSFVFAIKDSTYHHTFMTDFKFEFNKFYQLTITTDVGAIDSMNNYLAPVTVKVYIDGELQNCAYMTFNPLYNSGTLTNISLKYYRTNNSPIQPNFYKKDGTVFSPIQNTITFYSKCDNEQLGYGGALWLGKSNIIPAGREWGGGSPNPYRKMTKRFLNNIDVGVIHIYNSVLSNSQISDIYNTFGPRYQ